jgi:hypothetical protein
MFGLPEDEEYVEETDTGDQPLRDPQPTHISIQPTQIGIQLTQIGKRSKSQIHEAPDEEAENGHSRRLRQEDQTAQRSASNAENIAQRRHVCREDQTARGSAAAIKQSSQAPRAAAAPAPVPVPATAPPIGSRVTRSKGNVSTEALMASATDPYTDAEPMESPQRDHRKEPWRQTTHRSCSMTPSPLSIPRNLRNCRLSQLALSGFTRLNTILMGPYGTKHG